MPKKIPTLDPEELAKIMAAPSRVKAALSRRVNYSGNGCACYLPKTWIDKNVVVLLVEKESEPK